MTGRCILMTTCTGRTAGTANPNDRRLMVQDWACSWNYTTNMARPAGKIFMFLLFCLLRHVWYGDAS